MAHNPERLGFAFMESPVGVLTLLASERGLRAIQFGSVAPAADVRPAETPVLAATRRQLEEYFAGRRRAFDLPLDWRGTAFQQSVWQALLDIPFGETRSYGEVARAIGRPQAFRAVGGANGDNPLPIVVPCHRVIGASGRLTGYSGRGGLATKAKLLGLERGCAAHEVR